FSSRGRHTRFSRDWSSDVCSSDLIEREGVGAGRGRAQRFQQPRRGVPGFRRLAQVGAGRVRRVGGGGDRGQLAPRLAEIVPGIGDRKSTRLNSSHVKNSYAVFCLK